MMWTTTTTTKWCVPITQHSKEDIFMERGRESHLDQEASERAERIPSWRDWEKSSWRKEPVWSCE